MVHKEDLRRELLRSVPAMFRVRLKKAIEIAEKYYTQELRLSGESLLHHLLRSAKYYADLRIDFNGVIATLLHHPLPEHAYQDQVVFTEDVRRLLKNIDIVFAHARKESVDTKVIYKYILSFQDDIRIALVKLSEKFDNARTIDLLPMEKRVDVARRLLQIYAPLAEYLNLSEAHREFQLHGFRVYHPEEYESVALYVHDQQKMLISKIGEIRKAFEDVVEIVDVDAQIWGRVKSYYSIWRKQFKRSKEGKSSEIKSFNDLLAFTVMVDSVAQCYIVASALREYADSNSIFEDYIHTPKPNGFQELQVIGKFPELPGMNIEIQILTKEMYWQNTYGPASHFGYKLANTRLPKQTTEYKWLELVHQEIERVNKKELLAEASELKLQLFQDRIYVFTPKHRIIELTHGATAIDFAYQVHTKIGHSSEFAIINGKSQPLSTQLNSGDVVEIVTDSKKKYPTEEWLEFSKSKSTRAKIKLGLRKKVLENNANVS